MRRRINCIVIGIVLAIISFAYGRYHYVNQNSTKLTNPFNASEHTRVSNPFMDQHLIGDWMKDEKFFAIILPVGFVVGGLFLAAKI